MHPFSQFTSKLNNFRANEIPENIIGSTGIYSVYDLNTGAQIGKLYGVEGLFMPGYTGETISANQLKEIADMMLTIQLKLESISEG